VLAPELAEEDGVGYDVNEVSADGSSDFYTSMVMTVRAVMVVRAVVVRVMAVP